MKSQHHKYYTTNGFKFTEGKSCGCQSYYSRDYGSKGSIVIQVERCRKGKPHVRCPWEWIHAKGGEILRQQREGDIAGFQEFLNETVCLVSVP